MVRPKKEIPSPDTTEAVLWCEACRQFCLHRYAAVAEVEHEVRGRMEQFLQYVFECRCGNERAYGAIASYQRPTRRSDTGPKTEAAKGETSTP